MSVSAGGEEAVGVISPAGCVWRSPWPLALPDCCVSQEEETRLCVLTFALLSRV